MIRSNRVLRRNKIIVEVVRTHFQVLNHQIVETDEPPFTILANSRPMQNNETQFLPAGQRADFYRVLTCSEKLFVADDNAATTSDKIVNHLGFDWRVVGSKEWGDGGRHNTYTIIKIGHE